MPYYITKGRKILERGDSSKEGLKDGEKQFYFENELKKYEWDGNDNLINVWSNDDELNAISNAKADKIQALKKIAEEKLKDDYFDLNNSIGITALRSQAKTLLTQQTNEINALTTIEEINNY